MNCDVGPAAQSTYPTPAPTPGESRPHSSCSTQTYNVPSEHGGEASVDVIRADGGECRLGARDSLAGRIDGRVRSGRVLRVCPGTSSRITKFSEHEAD
jgi:hypothetical protein